MGGAHQWLILVPMMVDTVTVPNGLWWVTVVYGESHPGDALLISANDDLAVPALVAAGLPSHNHSRPWLCVGITQHWVITYNVPARKPAMSASSLGPLVNRC